MSAQVNFNIKGIDIETVREKLLKVQALMVKGEVGERIAAAKLLQKQLQKYGLTMEDLGEKEVKEVYWFKFNAKEERAVILQIYCKVIGVEGKFTYYISPRTTMICGLSMTKAQHIEMMDLVPLFLKQYRKEIERVKEAVLTAFLNKHQLLGASRDNTPCTLSPDQITQIIALMRDMDRVQLPFKKLSK